MRQWLQISAGRGPAECTAAVPRLLCCIVAEAEGEGITVEMLDSVPATFPNTLRSVLLAIDGEKSGPFIKSWTGTVLWICRSPFRPAYKRKNWFVGIEQLTVPAHPAWSANDIKVETMRASGPGGQHTNKTESAVRLIHLPTGLSVMAREERSQSQNKKLALARLWELYEARRRSGEMKAEKDRWSQHDALERGNPVRTYVGPDFVKQ